MDRLSEFKNKMFKDWCESVSNKIDGNLKQPILMRKGSNKEILALNLSPQVRNLFDLQGRFI